MLVSSTWTRYKSAGMFFPTTSPVIILNNLSFSASRKNNSNTNETGGSAFRLWIKIHNSTSTRHIIRNHASNWFTTISSSFIYQLTSRLDDKRKGCFPRVPLNLWSTQIYKIEFLFIVKIIGFISRYNVKNTKK